MSLEFEAQWMRERSIEEDVRRVWAALRHVSSTWTDQVTGKEASEQELLAAVYASTREFSGGRDAMLSYSSTSGRADLHFVVERESCLPYWTPAGVTMTLVERIAHEEVASVALLEALCGALECDWSYIGYPGAAVGGGGSLFDETMHGRPIVSWANFVSEHSYDIRGVEAELQVPEVAVKRVPSGVIAWVANVRWDRDNHRAKQGREAIRSVWWRRFPATMKMRETLAELAREAEDESVE
jgi:hypothetical protein